MINKVRNKIIELVNNNKINDIIDIFPMTDTHIHNFITQETTNELYRLGLPIENTHNYGLSLILLARINAIKIDATGYLVKRGGTVDLDLLDTPAII